MINERNSPQMKDFIAAGSVTGARIVPDRDSRRNGDAGSSAKGCTPPPFNGNLAAPESDQDESLFDAVSAAIEWFCNGSAALVLFILALPVFCTVALLVYLIDGAPVFYLGRRLGRHKYPFTMIKFRTLRNGSHSELRGQIHSHNHRLETRCGKFLRETRLDELPQLLNILKGDMNLFGPRPERDEVYESLCRHLNGYCRRFAVKPGLVGASQLFTPHSSPKRLRTFIDNRILEVKSHLRDILFVSLAALTVGKSAAVRIGSTLLDSLGMAARGRNRRKFQRLRPRRAMVRIAPLVQGRRPSDRERAGAMEPGEVPIVDINPEALCFHSPDRLADPGSRLRFNMKVRFRRRFRPSAGRIRSASGTAEVVQIRKVASGWAHVIRYVAASEMSRYVIHQYILKESLRPPFTS